MTNLFSNKESSILAHSQKKFLSLLTHIVQSRRKSCVCFLFVKRERGSSARSVRYSSKPIDLPISEVDCEKQKREREREKVERR